MGTRRTFIADAGKVALGSTVAMATQENKKSFKKMFVHHVYFWLNNARSQEDTRKLLEGLNKLSRVKTIKMFHIGKPAGTSREVIDGSYDVSWLVMFKNRADQDSYQIDPIHLQFVEECKNLWKKVVVYDSLEA